MEKLQLAFLWNHHQPYLKNARGYYQMPWVRLFSTRSYLDFLKLLDDYPRIQQTINITPSLLIQLQDYAENDAKDLIWILSEIPANKLTAENKATILDNFFVAKSQNMIKPYPRYYELYNRYKALRRKAEAPDIIDQFTTRDYLDTQVWYNLTWIGQLSRRKPAIQNLFDKGSDFSEADKQLLLEETRLLIQEMLPAYQRALSDKRIELTTSPKYHPVIPLLLDTQSALAARPGLQIPLPPIAFPDDAADQLREGIETFDQIFGQTPEGIWPPEGGISEAAARLLERHGIRWIATDESILIRSLGKRHDSVSRYRPWRFSQNGRPLDIFFRDHYLSDAIRVVYHKWDIDEAVDDFMDRLYTIRRRIVKRSGAASLKHHLVSIVLLGDKFWNHYKDAGYPFLARLFERLSKDKKVTTTTFSGFLERTSEAENLPRLIPGSWRNNSFNVWIGSEEDNRAWEQLRMTRAFLTAKEQEGVLPEDLLKQAWEHIYITEGSDWYWWYGEEHASDQDLELDQLFRENLMQVYEICGAEIPPELYQTIKQGEMTRFMSIKPERMIRPTIDGKESHRDEWQGAAAYNLQSAFLSTPDPDGQMMEQLFVGFNETTLFLRIDFRRAPLLMHEFVVSIKMPLQYLITISPLRGVMDRFGPLGDEPLRHLLNPSFRLKECLEIAISFEDLGIEGGDVLGFQISVRQNNTMIETFPFHQMIEVDIPETEHTRREWAIR